MSCKVDVPLIYLGNFIKVRNWHGIHLLLVLHVFFGVINKFDNLKFNYLTC